MSTKLLVTTIRANIVEWSIIHTEKPTVIENTLREASKSAAMTVSYSTAVIYREVVGIETVQTP